MSFESQQILIAICKKKVALIFVEDVVRHSALVYLLVMGLSRKRLFLYCLSSHAAISDVAATVCHLPMLTTTSVKRITS